MKITIYRKELIFDISNICYIEAHKLDYANGTKSAPVHAADICTGGNLDLVNRMLSSLSAHAANLLHPLCRKSVAAKILDNLPYTPGKYEYEIDDASVPGVVINMLTHSLHDYIVYRIVGEWLSITYPTASAKWAERCAVIADEIRAAVASVSAKPCTRRCSPF